MVSKFIHPKNKTWYSTKSFSESFAMRTIFASTQEDVKGSLASTRSSTYVDKKFNPTSEDKENLFLYLIIFTSCIHQIFFIS